jgi:tetratricopeptide (TPR) repeat protein
VIAERLTEADPSNALWQRGLSKDHIAIGQVLSAQGDLRGALTSVRKGLAIRERLAKADPNNADLRRDLQSAAHRIGGLAYQLVLAGDFAAALDASDQAIPFAPDSIWLHTNRAHALMLLGREDEARASYLKYQGTKNVHAGKSWETAILDDFGEMRRAGLAHSLMDEIETRFTPER